MKGYVARKGDRYYAVIYEGRDPLTGREPRRLASRRHVRDASTATGDRARGGPCLRSTGT